MADRCASGSPTWALSLALGLREDGVPVVVVVVGVGAFVLAHLREAPRVVGVGLEAVGHGHG